ncbi:unnamed protein product [Ectocarpus sp. 6 AP-2014]
MNFGSAYALHDSDDEDERVMEDAPPSGALSSMGAVPFGAGPALTRAFAGSPPAPQPAGTNIPHFIGLGGGLGIPHDAPVPAAAPPAAGAAAAGAGAGARAGAGGAGVPLWPPPPMKASAGVPASRLPVDFGASIGGDDGTSGKAKAKKAYRKCGFTPKYGAGGGSGAARPPQAPAPPPSRTWTRKVDTNILNVDMAALGNAAPYATGDATICNDCRACLSAVSVLAPVSDDSGAVVEDVYDWTCEFCHKTNRVELGLGELPVVGQDSVDYVLEAAPATAAAATQGKGAGADQDESAVLFVIDTSGSMCVTTAVEGRLALRGDRTKDMSRLLTAEDASNQHMPGQPRGMTYVSRLQSMQAAIDDQLETMAKETPSRHAGIVTFNGEVSLIGDGSGDSRVVAGDRLSDGEALKEVGRAYPLSRPIAEARSRLADRLFALEEGGPTALGPAVVAGLSMLEERGGRGSRLVLCTDGLANVGLGALDDLQNDEQRQVAESFYENLGRESSGNGVTIDVVSVDSDACDLENLGAMADVSGGTVTRVKASDLTSNFAGILANPILASQVSVRVTLHKGLKFRNADVGAEVNTLDRDIGNVTRETELNFEYQVRSRTERRALGIEDNGIISSPTVRIETPPNAADPTPGAGAGAGAAAVPTPPPLPPAAAAAAPPTSPAPAAETPRAALPFQVQVRYTRLDGTKCLRVLTKTQRVTKSKAAAERSMEMAVVAGHASSASGVLASKGAYQSTRVTMRAWNNLMSRNQTRETRAQVETYGMAMQALDSEVVQAQRSEGGASFGHAGGAVDDVLESLVHGRARKSARSGNDSLSYNAFRAKSGSKKKYQPEPTDRK